MKNTWKYNLFDVLEAARKGNTSKISVLLKAYSPLAVVNEDFSVLLLFRHFKVQLWKGERRILNCHPDGKLFQCGITIVTCADDGGSQGNIYLPNDLSYKELKIKEREVEIITDDSRTTKTNVTELLRKLNLWSNPTEEDIKNGFNSLCNEQYEKPKKPNVKSKTIELPFAGELVYNEEYEWYEGVIEIKGKDVELNVYHTTPKKLEKLVGFASNLLNARFYEEILLEMEGKMVKLKNDVWLGEDEETGEEEPPITVEVFRERISISSIVFYDDCSSTIYCSDDDIFWGHTIEINIDKNGKYVDANIAG